MIRECQAEGIAIAKQTPGTHPGRHRVLNTEQLHEARTRALMDQSEAQITRDFRIKRSTLNHYL